MTPVTDPLSSLVLVGVDGTTWDLLDPDSPVTLDHGLGSLHLPPVSHQWTQAPGKRGRRWRGSQMDAKSFSMNILVGDRGPVKRRGSEWRYLDGRFWRSVSTDALSTLIVNGQRKLEFRLDEGNDDFDFPEDPAILGKAVYPVLCIADDPVWKGDELSQTFQWQPHASLNYYGGESGLGPPFIVSEADLFETATLSNPGDIETWALWVLGGPARVVAFGVGDELTSLPFVLNDDDVVYVDTDEEEVTDGQGNSLWRQMGFGPIQFAPIPPGDAVPIRIGLEDAQFGASVTVRYTPLYLRGWGDRESPVAVGPPPPGGPSLGLGHSPLGHGPLGH